MLLTDNTMLSVEHPCVALDMSTTHAAHVRLLIERVLASPSVRDPSSCCGGSSLAVHASYYLCALLCDAEQCRTSIALSVSTDLDADILSCHQ